MPAWRRGRFWRCSAPPAGSASRRSSSARSLGARVIACASSEEKLAVARQHGADETLVYSPDTLKDDLRRLTDGRGVDVVYDAVGGDYAEPALRALAWKGRFLVVGFAAGEIPRIPLNLVLLKGIDVQGVHWGVFVEREPEAHRGQPAPAARLGRRGAPQRQGPRRLPPRGLRRGARDPQAPRGASARSCSAPEARQISPCALASATRSPCGRAPICWITSAAASAPRRAEVT